MTIANCPRCCEQVSVPAHASREATVRCPFCQEEYSLAAALDQLPPSLIVISDFSEAPAATVDDEDSPWSAINLGGDDADEVALAPMDDASPAVPFEFASGSAAAGGKAKTVIRPSSRARKPKGSPIKSVLSIVIGGLLAFPIAQLILWYLPGEWKRDPFRVGVIVAEYVPQIVPAKFRGNKVKEDSDSQPAAQGSGSGIPDFNFNGFGGGGADSGKSANTNSAKANNSKKKENKNDTANLSVEPPDEEQMSLEDSAAAGADLFGTPLEVPGLDLGTIPLNPLIDTPVSPLSPTEIPEAITKINREPSPEVPPQDDVPSTTEAPQPEVAPLTPGSIRNAPQVSSDNVAESVQAALSGNRAWDDDEATSPSGAIKKDFYFAFSKLGEALAFADRSDETVATQIAETGKLLKEVSQRADKLAVIGGVAKGWIAAGRESRKTNGVCLYGVVKAVDPVGDLFETTIESAGQQIAVVSTSDPAEYFALDSQVLVLGTIVDDPAKNLGGYEGSRSVVVVDGYHMNVSAE